VKISQLLTQTEFEEREVWLKETFPNMGKTEIIKPPVLPEHNRIKFMKKQMERAFHGLDTQKYYEFDFDTENDLMHFKLAWG
jgi:hypothetical protein